MKAGNRHRLNTVFFITMMLFFIASPVLVYTCGKAYHIEKHAQQRHEVPTLYYLKKETLDSDGFCKCFKGGEQND